MKSILNVVAAVCILSMNVSGQMMSMTKPRPPPGSEMKESSINVDKSEGQAIGGDQVMQHTLMTTSMNMGSLGDPNPKNTDKLVMSMSPQTFDNMKFPMETAVMPTLVQMDPSASTTNELPESTAPEINEDGDPSVQSFKNGELFARGPVIQEEPEKVVCDKGRPQTEEMSEPDLSILIVPTDQPLEAFVEETKPTKKIQTAIKQIQPPRPITTKSSKKMTPTKKVPTTKAAKLVKTTKSKSEKMIAANPEKMGKATTKKPAAKATTTKKNQRGQ